MFNSSDSGFEPIPFTIASCLDFEVSRALGEVAGCVKGSKQVLGSVSDLQPWPSNSSLENKEFNPPLVTMEDDMKQTAGRKDLPLEKKRAVKA